MVLCRTPHGVRGLKYCPAVIAWCAVWSHPSRGAWIEIYDLLRNLATLESHPSRGAWIEITFPHARRNAWHRRTPHGVRGLKFDLR